ncbi:MAG: cysteine protease [Sulfitobacter sp.]|nr:MAG: cysteine protease [Sulfitobacter sp.]
MKKKSASRSRPSVTLGWHPDVPDVRDLDLGRKEINKGLKQLNSSIVEDTPPPDRADNRSLCSPIEDQGDLGSCTAQAVVGLMEYMMRRGKDEHIDGSRLFVYKVTRRLMGTTDDSGAYLRTTMKAVSLFGVPPEQHCPYVIEDFNDEPSAFLYSYASNFQTLNYARLDPVNASQIKVLNTIKQVLAARYCVVFGFSVYSSLSGAADIPFPTGSDTLEGGHAVMAVGYDDNHMVGNKKVPSLIIRNSWGPEWGEAGYGYLPYEYILKGIAQDFWTCFKWEWISDGQFG